MRICFLTSTYPRSPSDGVGSFVKSLAEGLVARGHDVAVIAPDDPDVRPMDLSGVQMVRFRYPSAGGRCLLGHARAMDADVRLRRWAPIVLPGYVASCLHAAFRLHREKPFDLVNGHWAIPGGFVASLFARAVNRPLVISLHGSGVHFARRSRVYGMAARFGFRRASQVTACSTNLYDGALALGVSRERAQVIPYGVHVSMFDGHTDDMRAQMGIPAGTPVIGALGRLAHKKGFGKLIAAMPRVLEHLPDARCVIGGEGDLGSALQAQAESLGLRDRVLFPGFVDWRQVPSFMAMCDLVAVPSVVDAGGNVDGLPNVLLEAMASGRAVVASRVAGIPQAVEHGHSGLLVPPGDVEALATAIVGVLKDDSLRSRLGSAARARVASRFSWEAIVERFESVYLQALAEGQR